MFKRLAQRLPTIPATRNYPFRPRDPFQELIAAEGLILRSLEGLSMGFGQTVEALKTWIGSEDEELKHTFSTYSKLLNHWVSSFESVVMHITRTREYLKDVRTKEEELEYLRHLRQSLNYQANEMRKDVYGQGLTAVQVHVKKERLRRQTLTVNGEIKDKEENIGDWKRIRVRECMGLMFSGLLECSEKNTVVAMLGHTIIGNLSTGMTPPGLPQVYYSGKPQVEYFGVEAGRRLDNVSFPAGGVGDEAEQPPNEGGTDGIRRRPLPQNLPPKVPPKPITTVESQRGTTNNCNRHPHFSDTIGGQIQPDLETGRSRAPNHPSSSRVVVPVPPVQVKSEPLQDQQRMNPPVTARSERGGGAAYFRKLVQQTFNELAQERGFQKPEPFDGSPSGPGRSHDPNLRHGGHLQR